MSCCAGGAGMGIQQDQQEARGIQPSITSHAPLQQQYELDAVKQYMLLELALLIIEHDIKAIGLTKFKLPRLYESVLRGVQDRVLLDMANLRRMFRERGIKIYERLKKADGLLVQYVCRGYHHEKMLLWSVVKVECEAMLKRYMSQ
jgi:hypothetical protein